MVIFLIPNSHSSGIAVKVFDLWFVVHTFLLQSALEGKYKKCRPSFKNISHRLGYVSKTQLWQAQKLHLFINKTYLFCFNTQKEQDDNDN